MFTIFKNHIPIYKGVLLHLKPLQPYMLCAKFNWKCFNTVNIILFFLFYLTLKKGQSLSFKGFWWCLYFQNFAQASLQLIRRVTWSMGFLFLDSLLTKIEIFFEVSACNVRMHFLLLYVDPSPHTAFWDRFVWMYPGLTTQTLMLSLETSALRVSQNACRACLEAASVYIPSMCSHGYCK